MPAGVGACGALPAPPLTHAAYTAPGEPGTAVWHSPPEGRVMLPPLPHSPRAEPAPPQRSNPGRTEHGRIMRSAGRQAGRHLPRPAHWRSDSTQRNLLCLLLPSMCPGTTGLSLSACVPSGVALTGPHRCVHTAGRSPWQPALLHLVLETSRGFAESSIWRRGHPEKDGTAGTLVE